MNRAKSGGDSRRPRGRVAAGAVLLAVLFVLRADADWHIKQVAFLDRGQVMTDGRVVPYRISQDSSPLLIFHGEIPFNPNGLYFYRYASRNRYRLVKVDTGSTNSGFLPGSMSPWQAGDVNGTGPPELLAWNGDAEPGAVYLRAVLYAPRGQWHCPDSVAWYRTYDTTQIYGCEPFYITDLDQDGKKEIFVWDDARQRAYMYENVGQNMFHIVWEDFTLKGYQFAFGDFDLDDTMEFATADPQHPPNDCVMILKCTGDNQYVHWDSVLIALPNGDDVFAARNLDGSNRAVLFVSFIDYENGCRTYLYTFEPTQGKKGYQAFLVDSSVYNGEEPGMCAGSCCADIDGDGLDEVLWSCGDHVQAYRCTGPHQFERIWSWSQDSSEANVTAYDVNGNGYNEIIESGSGQTNIFEIEAIRVLNPNTNITLHPGDTCRIRWETFTPPRCDSVSLFLRTDTSWTLDTLIHGLPASDTDWVWTVPDIRSSYCHVVAMAYGPGWQYDESDTFFQILPLGVEEAAAPPVRQTELVGAFPNPLTAATRIQFQLREQELVKLRICDVTGRTVATLANGVMKCGVYHRDWEVAPTIPNGIYFIRLETPDCRETQKVILTR